ncbi:MAG: hypothetical protein OXN17_00995 [Candidatus Poribacteria bacterium]|nr:hypothetical protein [Candidatus Poribacteria bacterium]MDE0505223.1 hypothetical protein [Candidatus Poribacteria bacterium]
MVWESLYNAIVVPALYVVFHTIAKFDAKVRDGIAGRRNVLGKLESQLHSAPESKNTVWFHFASVGEFEQAKPVIEAIKYDSRIVLTYFSPSVHDNVARYSHCDASSYLPLDTRRNAEALLRLIKPTLLVYSKFDIWPNLLWSAARQKLPVILIAGTLHAKSKRTLPFLRPFLRSIHRHITLHCTISESDAERFRRICPPDARIEVTGDTRFDRVYQRAIAVEPGTELLPGQSTLSRQVLIAGSTYADDERVLLKACDLLRRDSPNICLHLVLVPHEPTPGRVRQIRGILSLKGLSCVCFSEMTEGMNLRDTDVIIVDTVGMLAKLYLMGDIVFVGGSFHGSVHNVMEPAAMAKPILFGPTVHNAYEALVLQDKGAAQLVNNANEMACLLKDWLHEPKERVRRGLIGRKVIEENLGATERTLTHLRTYLR